MKKKMSNTTLTSTEKTKNLYRSGRVGAHELRQEGRRTSRGVESPKSSFYFKSLYGRNFVIDVVNRMLIRGTD